ncbi:hypothetical protein, partial [Bradyrhizobium sp. 23AC]
PRIATGGNNGALASIAEVRNLLSTLDALESGQVPPWDILVQAGATLDRLSAEAEGPAGDPNQPQDTRGTAR